MRPEVAQNKLWFGGNGGMAYIRSAATCHSQIGIRDKPWAGSSNGSTEQHRGGFRDATFECCEAGIPFGMRYESDDDGTA